MINKAKPFLTLLLLWLLCLAPTPNSDASQRVAALSSPQTINVDIGLIQVGNVGDLSVIGAPSGATFSLLNNPGGHFSIVGTEIVADDSTPAGQYSISVQAVGAGFSVHKNFVLNFAGTGPPPAGVFSVGINLVGAEAPFPSFATTAQINYHANRLHGSLNPVPKFRFTLGWSKVNPLGQTVGIQPTAFGALDTTSTLYGGTSYVGAMNNVISTVMAAGGQVLLDIHEFGNAPGATTVGSAGCPFSCFGDLWGKIANYYVHTRPDLLAGIYGLDLMNEWKFIDSAIAFNANQAAITAIRANGYTGPIYIEGVNFTSAWNWTSGQGQSFNNSNLYQLVDPLNNTLSSAHMYPDPDDSGSQGAQTFAYNVAVATAGSAPTGLNVNPTIAVTRITREWQPWLALHGLRGHLGEYGSSTDNPWISGLFDYPDWNTITSNLLTYLQANNIEISIWASGNGGAGYGQNGYGYSLDPFNANLTGATDFTSTGIQAPVWTVIDNFTGHTGAQPTAYALFQPGLSTPNLYTTVGTPSAPFSIYYGGKIASSTVITPHDTLLDGTAGGGTFTPATITLANGDNGLATFTYTPSQAATFKISTTNNRGWTDPPFIGFSSQGATDPYAGLNYAALSNMYGLYDRFTPNTGPSLKLQRVSDNQQLDWGFTLLGNGFAQFDRGAIQTWASANSGIPIVAIHSIGPTANDITCTGATLPTFNLQNAAGYPEIVVPNGVRCEFNTPIPGVTALSTIARMNETSGGSLYRMDWFIGPIVFARSGNFQIFSTGCLPNGTVGGPGQGAINTSLSIGLVAGQYHDYGASYASGVTNGFQTYKDGSQVGQTTVAYTFGTCNAQTQAEFGWFKNGIEPWVGSLTNFELSPGLNYTPTQQAAIAAMDATYYSTPLPDTLPAVAPSITGAGARGCIVSKTCVPFAGVSVADTNTGTPLDDLTITLTGSSGGTLAGSGLSGTGPYTIAAASAASVTTTLRALIFTPSGSAGQSTTMTILAHSSAGSSATNSATVVAIQAVAPAETALAAPGGTFTPLNKSGPNIIAAQGGYPDASGFNHIYPTNAEIDYWAGTGSGSIRVPLFQLRLQPVTYGSLDPPSPRADGDNYSYVAYPAGTQTNLAEIKRVLDRARSHNMYVQLEFHQSVLVDTQNGINRTIGNDAEATNIGVDLWQRVATVYKNYDNAIFEYFNEPVASTVAGNFTFQTTIAAAVASITTLQWNYLATNFFSGGNTYVSRGEPASWNAWSPPAGLKWALVLHQYLNAANDGFTADVVLGKGASALSAATTSMRAAGIKAVLTETGWSPSNTIVSPGTGVPSTEGNAILNFAKTNNDVFVGWNYWLGGSAVFEGAWNAGIHSVFSAVPQGLNPVGTIVDAPQVTIMQSNFLFLLKRDLDPSSNDNDPMWLEKAA